MQGTSKTIFMPNGTPAPPLLTAEEAARLLRLSDGRSTQLAVRALHRYVRRGLLHPTRIGRCNRFATAELMAFIDRQTGA